MLVKEEVVELVTPGLCDRCGVRALYIASKGVLTLMFCGHHGDKLKQALASSGFKIDELS